MAKSNNFFEAKVAGGAIDVGTTCLKGMIRNHFGKESKRQSPKDTLKELAARVTTLEIKAKLAEKQKADIDPEKQAKEIDRIVKSEISQTLGLFDINPTTTTSLVPEGNDSKDLRFICGKIIKAGDRLVLVSPPGSGKSAWATQVGICVSEGRDPEFIENGNKGNTPQIVEYYDAELDSDDRSQRYGGYSVSPLFHFHDNCKYRSFYYLLKDIYDRTVNLTSDAMVIIDNVYGVMPSMTTNETKIFLDGLDIIQRRLLAKEVRLTIILVTHSTKDTSGVPTMKNVAGSAHFARFAKSIMFLYNRSDGNTVLITNKRRYLGDKNAYIMKISGDRYLHFDFVNTESLKFNPIDNLDVNDDDECNESQALQEAYTKPKWKGKLSLENTRKMKKFYVPGVTGHGFEATAKEFGLKYASEVQRELNSLDKYEAKLATYEEDCSE